MAQTMAYAYLKTIDGDEVMEFRREDFDEVMKRLRIKEVKKSDRILYFVTDNANLNRINFFQGDYFEMLHLNH